MSERRHRKPSRNPVMDTCGEVTGGGGMLLGSPMCFALEAVQQQHWKARSHPRTANPQRTDLIFLPV